MLDRDAKLAESRRFAFDPDQPVDADMTLTAKKPPPGPVRIVLVNREYARKRDQDLTRAGFLEAKHEHVFRLPSGDDRALAPHALKNAFAGEMRQGLLHRAEADGEQRRKLRLGRKPIARREQSAF